LKIGLVIIFLTSSINSFCSDTTNYPIKRNSFFATFGGKENFGSLNYERIFSIAKKLNWSYSIGIQPFGLKDQLSLPISLNAFTKGLMHHLEIDLSVNLFVDKVHFSGNRAINDYTKEYL
jgi:hypothetical protein